jgi:hypothetical protein
MPGTTTRTTTDNFNIVNSSQNNNNHNSNSESDHFNINNNMNPVDNGGNGVYTIQAMGSNPDRYLSNESLETNSSGESSHLGNIQHRKVRHLIIFKIVFY